MSDELKVPALRRLAAEIRADVDDLDSVHVDCAKSLDALDRREPSTLEVYGAGKLVHDFYTGLERIFSRVAPAFGGLPEGAAWHRTLLDDMALDIPDVRPRVLSRDSRDALDEILRFRHLYRNVYGFQLDWTRVRALLDQTVEVWPQVRADIGAFLGFLDGIGSASG